MSVSAPDVEPISSTREMARSAEHVSESVKIDRNRSQTASFASVMPLCSRNEPLMRFVFAAAACDKFWMYAFARVFPFAR